MPFTRITGSYVTHPLDAPERTADWEDFILTCNPDGSRTAMTLSRFPGNSIVRQVMQTVEADFTPRDGFARLYADGRYAGSVVRQVTGGEVTSVVFGPDGAPIDVSAFPFEAAREVLGYHPTAAEGWKLMKLDRSVPGVQTIELLTTSLTWNGGTMGHGRKVEMPVEYLGEEDMHVPAGTFACHRLLWRTGNIDGDLDIWVTRKDALMVRMNGYAKGHAYVLARCEETVFPDTNEFGDY